MRDSRTETLHQQILQEIEGKILSGEWPPGHRVPFEVDLAEAHGCSRMTVNKVMTQLAKAGLIERRRKSGSFVRQPQAQSAVLEIHDIEAEVRSLNLAYAYRLLASAQRRASKADAARLEIATGTPIRSVRALHLAGAEPFCLEERLINLAAVPDAGALAFIDEAPGRFLLRQVPWTTAEHRIEAVSADAALAEALQIAPRSACLAISRRTWNGAGDGPVSGEGAITAVRFSYPGHRHALVARFTPASG